MDSKVLMLFNCAIMAMLCICSVQSTNSNCKPESQRFKFWNCKGTTATFDPQAHQNLIDSIGGLYPNLDELRIDFTNDLWIETVVINSDSQLKIVSITSPKILSIKISGMKLSLSNLCMFSSNASLPRLESVEIKDATLENVEQHQFCEQCDDSSDFHRDVELTIKDSSIKTKKSSDDDSQILFFHEAKGIKSLKLENVEFVDVGKLVFESYPDIENGNGDDQVNFGKKNVQFKFKEVNDNNVLNRAVEELHIQGVTCLDNEDCIVIRGNTTRCRQDTDSNVTTGAPSNTNTTPDTSESSGGKTTSIPDTTTAPSSGSGSLIEYLSIPTLLVIMLHMIFCQENVIIIS